MIELQRKLIGDITRNTAFEAALHASIKPGDTVLDLGSGTGFLGFLASKFGAKQVICIEAGDIIETSKKLAKRNGIRNCTFIQKHSTDVQKIPLVDVIVSETLGNYALEENILETLNDAFRFLKPGGKIIPASLTLSACPVTSRRLQEDIDVWDRASFGIKLDEARHISLNNMYVKTLMIRDLLEMNNAIRHYDTINFLTKNHSIRTSTMDWTFTNDQTVEGIALWWDALLAPGITLSTSPYEPLTHWEQIYLPFLQRMNVPSGGKLRLELSSDTRYQVKVNLVWKTSVLDKNGTVIAEQKQDMREGW